MSCGYNYKEISCRPSSDSVLKCELKTLREDHNKLKKDFDELKEFANLTNDKLNIICDWINMKDDSLTIPKVNNTVPITTQLSANNCDSSCDCD